MVDWVKLELDVAGFDLDAFATHVDGVALTTLAALGDSEADRRRMYELNKTCSADIPGRGEFYTWPEYVQQRFEAPGFDPRAVVVAIAGDEWVGMAGASHRPDRDYAFNEMTGVVRSWRRRGLAMAMKLASVGFLKEAGIATVRTVHHPGNETIIALNRRLGYVDAHWPYP